VTLAGGDQVGGAATPFVEKLLEVHGRVLLKLSTIGRIRQVRCRKTASTMRD
jgi:hypothetical protein